MASSSASSSTGSQLGAAGLTVLLAGQLLPQIDFSIVNVALDAIAQTFHASATELDVSASVYGVASLLCGLAGSIWMLLFARMLQGVGAALIVPQILATIHVGLSGHEHSRAIGYYGAIGGLAFIIGQVLGGFLVSADIAGLG